MPVSKLVYAAALAALLLGACNKSDSGVPTGDEPRAPNNVAGLPPPYNTGDLDNGKAQFAQCRSCHTLTEGGADMVGPNLYGVFGRVAGTKPGFDYSPVLKAAGFTWDAQHINDWIAAPRTYMPGTKMTFLGLPEAKDRIDLIAYLKTESGYKAPAAP